MDIQVVPRVESPAAVLALVDKTVGEVGLDVLDEVALLEAGLVAETTAVGACTFVVESVGGRVHHLSFLTFYRVNRIKKSINTTKHRVDSVLGFFSSRPNWSPPTPSPAGECAPPWFRGGGGRGLKG
jgi:hypothetical protein